MKKDRNVVVTWLDACEHREILRHTIKSTKKFLVERRTTGFFLKEDKHGVVIATDIMEDGECEIVAIPKQMLISIE